MDKKIKSKVSQWKEYILFILAVIQVVGIIAASYLASKLAPLEQNIAVLQTEIKANNDQHADLVQKDAFDQLVIRIDHISNRVDSIFNILTK